MNLFFFTLSSIISVNVLNTYNAWHKDKRGTDVEAHFNGRLSDPYDLRNKLTLHLLYAPSLIERVAIIVTADFSDHEKAASQSSPTICTYHT